MTLECKQCGDVHEEAESLNGYCEKCVIRFIEAEERKIAARLKNYFKTRANDLKEI